MKPILTIPTALQVREGERGIPLDTLSEQSGQKAPSLSCDAGRSEDRNVRECDGWGDGQGMVAEQPITVVPEPTFEGDQLDESTQHTIRSRLDEGAQHTVQSRRSEGEC